MYLTSSCDGQPIFPSDKVLFAIFSPCNIIESYVYALILMTQCLVLLSGFWCNLSKCQASGGLEDCDLYVCVLVCAFIILRKVNAQLNILEKKTQDACWKKDEGKVIFKGTVGWMKWRGDGKSRGKLHTVLNQERKRQGCPGSLNIWFSPIFSISALNFSPSLLTRWASRINTSLEFLHAPKARIAKASSPEVISGSEKKSIQVKQGTCL